MKREVAAQKELFYGEQKELFDRLKEVESYLRDLLRDHEGGYAKRRELDKNDLMTIDSAVENFLGRRADNRDLFDPARGVRELVLELIERTTPDAPRQR
jgi:hypothetical protein